MASAFHLTDQMFRSICNQMTFSVGIIDVSTLSLLYINRYGEAELKLHAPVHANDLFVATLGLQPQELKTIAEVLEAGQPYTRSFLLAHQPAKWVQLSVEPVVDMPGFAVLKLADVSESVQTEETLLREIQRFEALFNHASMGILVVNQEGAVVLANPYAHQQFSYDASEMIGKKIEAFIPDRYLMRHQQHRDRYYKKPEARSMGHGLELFARRKGGDEFPVQISLGHFENQEGRFAIAFIVDDTGRKAYEHEIVAQKEEMARVNQQMKELNEVLEIKVAERTQLLQDTLRELERSRDDLSHALEKEKQLNDMKSRFVSMASHEFRTPLSTILSSVTLLSKYVTTDEQHKRDKHIDRIKSSVSTLTDILDEFLSLGRIEDGKVEPKWAEFSIKELVDAVFRQMEPLRKEGQQLKSEHYGHEMVRLDPGLLKNILINLLSNAIKFSPEKAVILVHTSKDKDLVEIRVKDQGLGISRQDQQHLFERFFRGANVTNIQGTGLGLHIVSRYVQLMNGAIRCQSELEHGTEFIVSFRQHRVNG